MTDKQRRFAEAYAKNPNATQAAIEAGYSSRSAYSQGNRMLRNDEVVAMIRELQDSISADHVASILEVKGVWSDVLRDTKQKTTDRLRAGELLAKSAGEFVQAVKVEAGLSGEFEIAAGDSTVVMIPWNGRDGEPNALELPGGEIVPLKGIAYNDVWLYVPRGSYTTQSEKGGNEEDVS